MRVSHVLMAFAIVGIVKINKEIVFFEIFIVDNTIFTYIRRVKMLTALFNY